MTSPHAHSPTRCYELPLVVAWLAIVAAGCGGRDQRGTQSSAGATNEPQSSIPACPNAKVLDAAESPCLIGQSCASGLCEDPRGPISIGCPGVSFPECASDGDCGPGQRCVSDTVPCGPAMKCAQSCTATSCGSDEQCGSDGKCAPISCENGYQCQAGWLCMPLRPRARGQAYEFSDAHDCSPASCVDDGFICPADAPCNRSAGPDLHGCNPARCDQGGSCPEDSRCRPADASLGNGCVPLPCAHDSDCDCGACLMGECAYQPGVCVAQLL